MSIRLYFCRRTNCVESQQGTITLQAWCDTFKIYLHSNQSLSLCTVKIDAIRESLGLYNILWLPRDVIKATTRGIVLQTPGGKFKFKNSMTVNYVSSVEHTYRIRRHSNIESPDMAYATVQAAGLHRSNWWLTPYIDWFPMHFPDEKEAI